MPRKKIDERGQLVKRGRVWVIRETIERTNPTRKEYIRATTGTKNKLLAEDFRRKLFKQFELEDQDRKNLYTRIKLIEGLREYIDDHVEIHNKRPDIARTTLNRLLGKNGHWKFPDVYTDELIPVYIQKLVAARIRRGLAGSTINKELRLLSAGLKWLRKHKDIRDSLHERNEFAWTDYTVPTFEKKRWINMAQLEELLSLITSEDQRDLALGIALTGSRPGECRWLRWDQIDLSETEGSIHLERTKVEGTEYQDFTIKLNSVLLEMFKRRWNTYNTLGNSVPTYVFESPIVLGQPIGRPRQIDKAIKRMGLNDNERLVKRKGKFTVHSLRDSFASLALQNGMAITEVQQCLGHSNVKQTQKYARHLEGEATKKAAKIFENFDLNKVEDNANDNNDLVAGCAA